MAAWIKMSLGMELGLGRGDFVRWRPQSTLPKGGRAPSPIFGPFLLCQNCWMHQDATWYGCRPQPRGLVLDGDPVPLPKNGWSPPKFLAHDYCGQTAGCIKVPLGMEVGLSPGDFVLDGDQPPIPKGAQLHSIFGTRLLWPKGCMDQDATLYRGRPRPTRYCVRCGPSYPQKKGHTHSNPIFGPCPLWPNGWMDEDADWYGCRLRPRPHCTRRGPSSRERGTAAPLFLGPCLLWSRSPISAELLLIKSMQHLSEQMQF